MNPKQGLEVKIIRLTDLSQFLCHILPGFFSCTLFQVNHPFAPVRRVLTGSESIWYSRVTNRWFSICLRKSLFNYINTSYITETYFKYIALYAQFSCRFWLQVFRASGSSISAISPSELKMCHFRLNFCLFSGSWFCVYFDHFS